MRKTFTAISIACVLAVSGIAIARYTHDGTATKARTAAKSALQSGSGMPSSAPSTLGNIRIGTKADKSAAPQTTMSSGVRTTSGIRSYISPQTQGVIGIPEGRVSDNPEDNIFAISLPQVVENNSRAWLSYEVRGIAPDGVSWSVNDRPSVGGYLLSRTDSWTAVREEISPEWLQSGRNTVLFSIPSEAGCAYTVRNVSIETATSDTKTNGTAAIVLSSLPTARSGKAYIHGFVKGKVSNVSVEGEPLALNGNEFEGLVPVRDGGLHLTADLPSGKLEKSVKIQKGKPADYARAFVAAGNGDGKRFLADRADSLSVGGSSLSVAKGDIAKSAKFTIASLRETDIPALDYGMTNVTAKDEGYRFLPHGNHFEGKGATVRIKYDRTKIPSGFTEDDINTYYFDRDTRHWVALERVKVDKATASVISRTTHFTDMINGVIKAPESPQTDGFTPTMMNDIKAADPTAKINLITPPTANNRGSACLQYGFEMPPARNGMTPSLGIQYSSEGGSGWLGEGWNLSAPSITLDTRWGVPRYDTAQETETYLLSGSMLSTMGEDGRMGVAHRGEKMNRKADRQFYTRQGGDFSRIIRKGDSPSNYYWEVTDKQGIKYTYGGEGAVLKGTVTDASGNSREVIAEWKLRRVEETHGDYIEYVYETADESVRGGLTAKAVYLKEVRAGNSGQAPHTVVVFEGTKEKHLKTNNARYGFLVSSNRLLEKVTVNFQGSVLRSYAFTYGQGAFNKDVLTGVRHLDDKGQEVSFQNFAYYDDVQSGKGYVPFKDGQETWNTHDDGLDAGFVNPLQAVSKRFSDKPTALGGTTSTSVSGSFYAGVGVVDGSPWKGNTVGGSYSYSSDTSKGLSALVDLNGDGLPDKVYKQGGTVYYRPQVRTANGSVAYGTPVKVRGISSFSSVKSSTNSFGASAVVGWNVLTAVVGTDKSTTKTRTTQYFSDINGDGLVDLVSNGKVYFNHLEFDSDGNAVPTFTLSSADTPSPIIYGGKVDTSVMEVSKEEQAEAVKNSPMEDIVRVWQAPKDGTVSVTGQVSLIGPTGDYDADAYQKADGVRVAIQKGAEELWNKTIARGDNSPYSAAVSSVTVKRGDRLYFRVQSGSEEMSNGSFDKVSWSPIITYAGASETIPNGLSSTEYKPEDGAIYDVSTSASVDNGGSVEVRSTFHKPVTTDDVVLSIIGSNDKKDSNGNDNPSYVEKTVYSRTLKAKEAVSGDSLNVSLDNAVKLTNFSLEISSTSNVDWKNIGWQASVTYRDSSDTEVAQAVPAHYRTFNNAVTEGKAFQTDAKDTALVVTPVLVFSDNVLNGQVTLTAKTVDSLLGKKTFNIVSGLLQSDTLRLSDTGGKKIWFEFSLPSTISDGALTSASVSVQKDAAGLVTETIPAGFYAEKANDGFGMLYRGWGGFVYNAAEGRYGKPIDESLLKLPESENDKVDPLTMAFTPLGTDQTTMDRWVGQRQDIYLTATEAGTARLTEQDVLLTNPLESDGEVAGLAGACLQGTGAAAVSQVMTSKSTVVQGGAMGITHNDAKGSARTEVTMMDMNGDGYPDIIAGGSVQYTNTQGGLSGEVYRGVGSNNSDNASQSWGYGGNPVASVSSITNLISKGKATILNDQTSWLAKFSISGSAPKNTDEAVESFIDVNGDGLPDKILSDKKVRLNLGYTFTEPIDWGLDRIQGGKSLAYNFGAGGGSEQGWGKFEKYKDINKASGSYSAGFGIVTSESEEEYNLIDINSDGLPDKVWKNDNDIIVALNTGNGFDEPVGWKGASALSESASTSESVNAAFTLTINIPVIHIKISTNPGASASHSINRTTYSLQDVDGDGYLDIVESEKESELKVTRSAIGRTNMLKTVTNSLGGTFTLDYKHTTPTYGLPGGKWVMSSVTVDDGIHDDGPLTKTIFDYSDGQKDRHEREFLGFGKVVTKNIDTEKSDSAVYRQAVQLYDVSNYYVQGNELGASVEDAEGNK
ncbi:MAG: toxin TcdB middle/N-terminal domain-containing protein, partial [Prevotella sp.]